MFVLARALTYAALFIGFVLVFLPARILSSWGITPPADIGVSQAAGMAMVALGAALALWCVLTFAFVGRGTPAPFDPPRLLVVLGPYRVVRNPMIIGVGLALGGAALFYRSAALLGFTGAFFLAEYLFVLLYEEPTLRRTFGADYESYSQQVRRWWPKL